MIPRLVLACETSSLKFFDRTLYLDEAGLEVLRAGCGSPRSVQSEENAVFDCKCMSRHHARIWFEYGRFFVQDSNSSNGTFVNGKRLSNMGDNALPTELFTNDTVQFGIHIVDHNTHEIIQRCIIATVQCYTTSDKGGVSALGDCRPSTVAAVLPTDINLLNMYVQKALHRESILENKLTQMKRLIELSARACQRGWKSMIQEDDLMARIYFLERQIEVYSKDYTDDKLRNELLELRNEKLMYHKTERESIEKNIRPIDNGGDKCKIHIVELNNVLFVKEKIASLNWESERTLELDGSGQPDEGKFQFKTIKEESKRLRCCLLECEAEIMERMTRINALEEKLNMNQLEIKTIVDEVHFSESELERAEINKDHHLKKCFDVDYKLRDLDSVMLANKIIHYRKKKESEAEIQRILKEYEYATGLIALKATSEVKVQSAGLVIQRSRDDLVTYRGKLNAKTEDGNALRSQINQVLDEVLVKLETYETIEARSGWLKGLMSEIKATEKVVGVRLATKQNCIEELKSELSRITQERDARNELLHVNENKEVVPDPSPVEERIMGEDVSSEEVKNGSITKENILDVVERVNDEVDTNKVPGMKRESVDLITNLTDLEMLVNELVKSKAVKALQNQDELCENIQKFSIKVEETNSLTESIDQASRFKELELRIKELVDDDVLKLEEKDRLLEDERSKNKALLSRLQEMESAENKTSLLTEEDVLEEKDRVIIQHFQELSELSESISKERAQFDKVVLLNMGKIEDTKESFGINSLSNSTETGENQTEVRLNVVEMADTDNNKALSDKQLTLSNISHIKPSPVIDLLSDEETDFRHVMQQFNEMQQVNEIQPLTTNVNLATHVLCKDTNDAIESGKDLPVNNSIIIQEESSKVDEHISSEGISRRFAKEKLSIGKEMSSEEVFEDFELNNWVESIEKDCGEGEEGASKDSTCGDLEVAVNEDVDDTKLKTEPTDRPANFNDLPISPKKIDYSLVDESQVSNTFEFIAEVPNTWNDSNKSPTRILKHAPKRTSKSIVLVDSASGPLRRGPIESDVDKEDSCSPRATTFNKDDSSESVVLPAVNIVQEENCSLTRNGAESSDVENGSFQTIQTVITVMIALICIFVAVELLY